MKSLKADTKEKLVLGGFSDNKDGQSFIPWFRQKYALLLTKASENGDKNALYASFYGADKLGTNI